MSKIIRNPRRLAARAIRGISASVFADQFSLLKMNTTSAVHSKHSEPLPIPLKSSRGSPLCPLASDESRRQREGRLAGRASPFSEHLE